MARKKIRPDRKIEKPRDFKATFKRLRDELNEYRIKFLLMIVIGIIASIFTIGAPIVMGRITNIILEGIRGEGIDFSRINFWIILLAFLYGVASIFQYLQELIMVRTSQDLILKLREKTNDKISKLPLSYFDSKGTGEILSRVVNDMDNISNTLQQSLIQIINSVISLVGILIMMFFISPSITLITLIIIPLNIIAAKTITKYSRRHFSDSAKYLGDLNSQIEEVYSNHMTVKAYNGEENFMADYRAINENLYQSNRKAQFLSGIIMPIISLINNISYIIISVLGGIYVINRLITIGDIQAFIQYSRQFGHPIAQLAETSNIIQSTLASSERVFELLDAKEEENNPITRGPIEEPKGSVEFNNIYFGYGEEDLIQDMSIKVRAGQTVAIVGPTGAGKTTLVNLLMRFYEVRKGQILVDGINIRDMKKTDVRDLFGMVLQDTWLFTGTIADNIGYGLENPREEDIIEAAKLSQAHHFISTLSEGYNTDLDEEGSNISIGQKQLLTIARTILKNPKILILDEATSNVDTRTELLIQGAMKNLMKGRTSFVIAHRLSTIENADLILVMDKGQIVEKGNHQELLGKKGFYEKLYKSQFSG